MERANGLNMMKWNNLYQRGSLLFRTLFIAKKTEEGKSNEPLTIEIRSFDCTDIRNINEIRRYTLRPVKKKKI